MRRALRATAAVFVALATSAIVLLTSITAGHAYDAGRSTLVAGASESTPRPPEQVILGRAALAGPSPSGYDDRPQFSRASRRQGDYRLAPQTTGGSQRIYRAVEPDKLADLVGSGQYRNIPGIGDGKYFFPTKQQADAFGEMMAKRNMGGPYCTTSGCIPSNLLRQVDRITPAGEGPAYYVPESMLRYIDDIIVHAG